MPPSTASDMPVVSPHYFLNVPQLLERMLDGTETLRMANQQMPAGFQSFHQFADQHFLRGPVEIDHDVPAHYQMEAVRERILRLQQIHVPELHVAA